MKNEKFAFHKGKCWEIPLTADGDEYLGDLKISWEKCLAAANGNELMADMIYEGATNDGLPDYRVPIELLED